MTKSKKTSFKLLICMLAMLLLATVLVACNNGDGPAHYDYLVTFEYNKGNLTGNTPTQYIGVFANSLVSIRPGYSDGKNNLEEGVVNGYYIEGWYLPAELDENGNPVKDENGFVILGEKWDFKTQRVNENITLYGNFKKKTAIRFIDRATGEYISGDTGRIERIPGENAYKPSDSSAPRKAGYTFFGKYYVAQEGEEEFKWPVRVGEEDINVYVEFLKGEWMFVSSESSFVSAIRANRNIYLQKSLDFGNYLENMLWGLSMYTGEINGNGYTISNVSRELTASRRDTDYFGGIFGELGETAYIHDIIFENINVEFKVNSSYSQIDAYVGLLACRVLEGAKLENVKVSGTLTYTPNKDHPISAGAIGDNKAKKEDIKECDFDSVKVVENTVA